MVVRQTTTDTMTTVGDRTGPHLVVNGRVNASSNGTDGSDLDGSGLFPTLEPMDPNVLSGDGLRGRLVVRRETLVIANALRSDSGLYECRGVNTMGSGSSSAYVLIGGKMDDVWSLLV